MICADHKDQHSKKINVQTKDAYNNWSKTYDTVENKTRDLEGEAIQSVLKNIRVGRILELVAEPEKILCGLKTNANF